MKGKIVEIIEPFGERTSKAGKTYSALKALVKLEDGNTATMFVFDDKEVGDELELVKKGDYWNVVSQKQQKNDDISKMLNAIYENTQKILKLVDTEEIDL